MGKSVYLLDEVIGIEGHQRITVGAAASILKETLEISYRKRGEHARQLNRIQAVTLNWAVLLLILAEKAGWLF